MNENKKAKKLRAQVVNGDLEIAKYKMRQKIKSLEKSVMNGSKYVLFGAGIGLGLIGRSKMKNIF